MGIAQGGHGQAGPPAPSSCGMQGRGSQGQHRSTGSLQRLITQTWILTQLHHLQGLPSSNLNYGYIKMAALRPLMVTGASRDPAHIPLHLGAV